jgi:hypothetical protein
VTGVGFFAMLKNTPLPLSRGEPNALAISKITIFPRFLKQILPSGIY